MRQTLVVLLVSCTLIACAGTESSPPQTVTEASFTSTPEPGSATPALTLPDETPTLPATSDDFFAQMGITLPAPTCNRLTQSQTEGPYYKPDTPERNSLFEDGMQGTRLILVGYVLDQDCQPLSNAWLDFW